MEQKTSPQHSRSRRFLFAVLTWVAALALVEVAVRVARPEVGQPFYPGYPSGLVLPDDNLGHVYTRGFNGTFPAYSDIPVITNSRGFRDLEWPATPDAARPRVMVLGDSVTMGSAVRREQRYTEQAAFNLMQRAKPIEFCNCGVNGYNVEQYATMLKLRGKELQPNFVLVGLVLNDAEPLDPEDARRIDLAAAVRAGSNWAGLRVFARDHQFDLGQSYAYNLIRRGVKARMWASKDYAAQMAKRYNDETIANLKRIFQDGTAIRRLRYNLKTMDEFARQQLGARLAVVVFPYHSQLTSNDRTISRQIDDLLQELNIACVDLFDVFLPKLSAELYVAGDDCHPNAAGHQLAGEAAAELMDVLTTKTE